jgi:hypothetical protein
VCPLFAVPEAIRTSGKWVKNGLLTRLRHRVLLVRGRVGAAAHWQACHFEWYIVEASGRLLPGAHPNMKIRLHIVSVLVAVLSLAYTLAHAETAKKSRSVASRTATCKADCRSGNTHGLYRAYNSADPTLMSPEGRKLYAECVRLCLAPLPTWYFQKPLIEAGLPWGKMFKSDCLNCHAKGETKGRWPGAITLPDQLRQGP